jgi:hypothetical protein
VDTTGSFYSFILKNRTEINNNLRNYVLISESPKIENSIFDPGRLTEMQSSNRGAGVRPTLS